MLAFLGLGKFCQDYDYDGYSEACTINNRNESSNDVNAH